MVSLGEKTVGFHDQTDMCSFTAISSVISFELWWFNGFLIEFLSSAGCRDFQGQTSMSHVHRAQSHLFDFRRADFFFYLRNINIKWISEILLMAYEVSFYFEIEFSHVNASGQNSHQINTL